MRRLARAALFLCVIGGASGVGLVTWPIGVEPPSTLERLEGDRDKVNKEEL